MSENLLARVKTHIIDDGGFLSGYSLRYYRWTDADLKGSGGVALLRMSGTSGTVNRVVQQHDVSLILLAGPRSVRQADSDMLQITRYLRSGSGYTNNSNVYSFTPLQAYTGPNYLDNKRATFEMVIRCGVEDH